MTIDEDDKKQPTAYDVDEVVEELELESFKFGKDGFSEKYVRLSDAIEIVKQGCVASTTRAISAEGRVRKCQR